MTQPQPSSVDPRSLADPRRWADPAQPVLTFYDDGTGERVEFSARTLANWVAKTANLGTDLLDLEPGDTVVLDLPTHWLGVVWVLASMTAGWRVAVIDGPGHQPVDAGGAAVAENAEVLVTSAATSDLLTRYREVAVVSTRPLAVSFGPGLPAGALDYAAEVSGCADVFVAGSGSSVAEDPWMSGAVAAASATSPADRILTGARPTSVAGVVDVVIAPALATASVVLVANLDELSTDRVEALSATERTTIRR